MAPSSRSCTREIVAAPLRRPSDSIGIRVLPIGCTHVLCGSRSDGQSVYLPIRTIPSILRLLELKYTRQILHLAHAS